MDELCELLVDFSCLLHFEFRPLFDWVPEAYLLKHGMDGLRGLQVLFYNLVLQGQGLFPGHE